MPLAATCPGVPRPSSPEHLAPSVDGGHPGGAAALSRPRPLRALLHSREGDLDWDRLAIGAIVVGVVLRAVFGFALHPPEGYVYADMQGYVSRAMRVAFGGSPSPFSVRALALDPPGTQLSLALVFKLFGRGASGLHAAAAMWFAFSALVPLLAWRLARLLLNPPAGALTAVLAAVYPLFILYSGYFTSETPAIALLCGALWLGYRAGRSSPRAGLALGAGGGLLGGALVATRPQFILNLALVLIPLLGDLRARWRAALGFAVGLAVVLGAVLAVNSGNAGHLTGVSENGGITFYQAQCNVHEVFIGQPPTQTFFGNPVSEQLHRGQDVYLPDRRPWDQGFFYDQGLKCIGREGFGHVFVFFRELLDLTVTSIPWPPVGEPAISVIAEVTNIVYCAVLLGLLLLVALARRRWALRGRTRSGPWILAAQLAMLAPVTIVFGSEPRYRVPYDVFGLALVAWLVADRLPIGRRYTQ